MGQHDPKRIDGIYLIGTTECDLECPRCKFVRPEGLLVTNDKEILEFIKWSIYSHYVFDYINVVCGDPLMWGKTAKHMLEALSVSGITRQLNLVTCGLRLFPPRVSEFAEMTRRVKTIYFLENEYNQEFRTTLRTTLAVKKRKVVFVREAEPITEDKTVCLARGITIGGGQAYQCLMAPFVRSLVQVTDKSRPLVSTPINREMFVSHFADMEMPAKYICSACRFNDDFKRNPVDPVNSI